VLSTTQAAAMAKTTRHTVEREIRRGNLKAEKVGRQWVIKPTEAERWAAQFCPYSALRKPPAGRRRKG
jgi:excisionase family DNA binding protein